MRKICYISGTRADFGLMKSTLIQAAQSPFLDISVCITGMHDLNGIGALGKTASEILDSGLKVCATIKTPTLEKRSGVGMAQAIAVQISGFVDVFEKEKFDMILLLGDRGEMLAAAIAAVHLGIPITHIHGGEVSGTIDDSIRHAVSKLSHYHLVSTESARNRLIKMGENPAHILCTGAPGLDDIKNLTFQSREELFASVGFNPEVKTCLVVYHPVVQEKNKTKHHVIDLLSVLQSKKIQAIILKPNTDAGSQGIIEAIEHFEHHSLFRIYDHCLREKYLNWLKQCDFMIGNSSSGIIEACSFQQHVVDIGTRQCTREISLNTQRVSNDPADISQAIDHALIQQKQPWVNIYGDGNSGQRIVEFLEKTNINTDILNKVCVY